MINQIIHEVQKQLNWTASREIECLKWNENALKIVANSKKIQIHYSKNYQIARALLVAKTKGELNYEYKEDYQYDSISYMADCSRNAVLNIETVKKLIRTLSMLGYNELQLYMEDTYEIEGEPMFGYLRGRYTQNELKEMNAYAQNYDVELVPCIQTLAHIKQIQRWAQYAGLFDCNDILLCGDEKVYALIDKMFSSLANCFSSRKIHLGMDEAHMLGRGRYLTQNGYRDPILIFVEHLNKVNEIAKKYGFKCMIWGDMFHRLCNGSYEGNFSDGANNITLTNEIMKKLPKDVELVYWDYYATQTEHYINMIDSYSSFENELWFAGGVWKFSGWVPHNNYAISTIKASIPAIKAKNIKKIMTTGWGDDGAECSIFAVLPSIAYFSLYALGKTHAEIEDQFLALTGYTLENYLRVDDLHYLYSKSPVKLPITVTKNALYNDLFLGYLDKLHKGERKECFEKAILRMKEVPNGEYDYIFKTLVSFGEVMMLKYDMGIRIHNAYDKKDKTELSKIVEDIDLLIIKLEEFYEAFRTCWYTENKPQGFEVQDLRLGGLNMRLKNCKRVLQSYINGEIEEIPELKEKLTEEAFGSATVDNFNVNTWNVNCTANVLF